MDSLGLHIHIQFPPSEQMHWVQKHTSLLVYYQPNNNKVFWFCLHDKYLDSHYVFVAGVEGCVFIDFMNSLILLSFSHHH